jgi:hypothetical protein
VRSTTCKRSAAPVGLVVLLVVAISTPNAWAQSEVLLQGETHLRSYANPGTPVGSLATLASATATSGSRSVCVAAINVGNGTNESLGCQTLFVSHRSSEVGVYRDGEWHLRGDNGFTAQFFTYGGLSNDKPVVGDWNGDGLDEVGVYRDGEWHLRNNNGISYGGAYNIYGGLSDDEPVVGDWYAEGKDQVGIFRGGEWHFRNKELLTGQFFRYGGATNDKPVVGDWDSA